MAVALYKAYALFRVAIELQAASHGLFAAWTVDNDRFVVVR
jgi:hypothetical protein